jgi:hypothetical protein
VLDGHPGRVERRPELREPLRVVRAERLVGVGVDGLELVGGCVAVVPLAGLVEGGGGRLFALPVMVTSRLARRGFEGWCADGHA